MPFIHDCSSSPKMPSPATSAPRDQGVLQAVRVALIGTRQNPSLASVAAPHHSSLLACLSLSLCVASAFCFLKASTQYCVNPIYTRRSPSHAEHPPATLCCGPGRLLASLPLAVQCERIGGPTAWWIHKLARRVGLVLFNLWRFRNAVAVRIVLGHE